MTGSPTGRAGKDAAAAGATDDVSTRYLCAGAHLDWLFARDVLRAVLRQPRRAIGPSYGCDTGLVIRHCVSAYRRRLMRDVALAALVVASFLPYLHGRPGLLLALPVAAWGVVLLEAAVVHFELLAVRFHPRRPELRLATGSRLEARLAEIDGAHAVNVTVFSGYAPFVGSGADLGAWSFWVNLDKGKEDVGARRIPERVDVGELRERVRSAVLATGIDGLSVSDGLYVDGGKTDALPIQPKGPHTRPVGYVDPAEVRQRVDIASMGCRHYHRIEVTAWGGEIVLSIFLRFHIVSGRLYAEANYRVLTPVVHAWHVIDELKPGPLAWQVSKLAGQAFRNALPAAIFAVPRLVDEAMRAWFTEPMEKLAEKAAFRDGRAIDHGALLTVRQRGASDSCRRYFQKLDHEMWVKLLEGAILDTVVAVLDERQVDTSSLVERQGTILNQGVLMTGGSLRADSLAVGRGARIGAVGQPGGDRGTKMSARMRRAVAAARKA